MAANFMSLELHGWGSHVVLRRPEGSTRRISGNERVLEAQEHQKSGGRHGGIDEAALLTKPDDNYGAFASNRKRLILAIWQPGTDRRNGNLALSTFAGGTRSNVGIPLFATIIFRI